MTWSLRLTFSRRCVRWNTDILRAVCQSVVMAAKTRREERIESILRAAIPVFAAQGYRNTSMADLAAAAGVSRPALYQYFDDRADLVVA